MAATNPTGPNTGNQNPHVSAYKAPKIPAFTRSNLLPWFTQAEITMFNAKITDSATKADNVAEKLDADAIMCVIDILNSTPRPNNLHKQIKERAIATFSGSAEEHL